MTSVGARQASRAAAPGESDVTVVADSAESTVAAGSTRLRDWAISCLAVASWFISRPYEGIYHDARLYTLQALGRLHPQSLGQDVFLRFGSQDAFTLFSPIYAAAIRVLGVEDAARLLTLLGHAWWFAAAYLVARRLLGPSVTQSRS